LAAFVVAGFVFLSVRDSLFLSVLAIFVTALLAIRLHRVALAALHVDGGCRDAIRDPGGTGLWARVRRNWVWWVIIVLPLVVGAGLLAAWVLFDHREGFALFGVALVYLALGLGVEQLREIEPTPTVWFLAVLGGLVGLTVLLLVAVVAGFERAIWAAAIVFVLTPTGLALVSEVGLDRLGRSPFNGLRRSLLVAAAGAVVLGLGLALVSVAGMSLPFVLALGSVLLVLMTAIAARSNMDVVFIIAAAAVVWALGHRSVPEPDSLRPQDQDAIFVAIGDSWMSGEGAEEFFDGTNDPDVNTCRRAPTAYAATLPLERNENVPDHLLFLACSGAKAHEIGRQLEQLPDDIGERDVEFVLLSVGGNDALFGTIGRGCLLPIDCTQLGDAWRANLDTVVARLDEVYAEVQAALPGVPVFVAAYPVPITPDKPSDCDYSIFTGAEHAFLAGFVEALNDAVATAVADADDGVEFVDTMPNAFASQDLRLCDGEPGDVGVNFLAANSVLGSLEQSVNPMNWVHNSLHPNARGHEAMRAAFVQWLDARAGEDVEGDTGTDDTDDTEAAQPTDDDAPCLDERGSDLESCSWNWMARQFAGFLLTQGLLVLPSVAGAWVLALLAVRLWREIFGEPTTDAG
jgi:lysophospholipase L1-like esterase